MANKEKTKNKVKYEFDKWHIYNLYRYHNNTVVLLIILTNCYCDSPTYLLKPYDIFCELNFDKFRSLLFSSIAALKAHSCSQIFHAELDRLLTKL